MICVPEAPLVQVHWVCCRLQGSPQADGEIDGTTLDQLGPLVPFLDRDSLALVDRKALALRLEEMRNFCLPKEALQDISSLLTQRDLLGWNGTTYFWLPRPTQLHAVKILRHLVHAHNGLSLSGSRQVGTLGMWNIWAGWCFLSLPSRLTPFHWWDWAQKHFLFFAISKITCSFPPLLHQPQTVLNKDTVEQVLVGQNRWEDSVVGRVCEAHCVDRQHQKQQTHSLIRGIVKARSRRAKGWVDVQ